ncbi:response regulator transcription factor [Pseudonocardia ailaonensis]|uniref:Response regulator transcription factor n=1 Tax=Pseudonocardia ailaonensis TaxID=367279 RepID=A0ABN2MZ17_9PSEU
MSKIRTYLVDDHEIVRQGLRAFLESAGDVEVVGETADGRQALREIDELARAGCPADVVVTDLLMPEVGGLEIARGVVELGAPTRVVVLSAYGDSDRVRRALAQEVSAYVMKSSRPDTILASVRAAAKGEQYLDPALALRLVQAVDGRTTPALTKREHEVAALVAEGKSNLEIAADLFVSERTARTHVSHILTKLNFRSRVQLALWVRGDGPDP